MRSEEGRDGVLVLYFGFGARLGAGWVLRRLVGRVSITSESDSGSDGSDSDGEATDGSSERKSLSSNASWRVLDRVFARFGLSAAIRALFRAAILRVLVDCDVVWDKFCGGRWRCRVALVGRVNTCERATPNPKRSKNVFCVFSSNEALEHYALRTASGSRLAQTQLIYIQRINPHLPHPQRPRHLNPPTVTLSRPTVRDLALIEVDNPINPVLGLARVGVCELERFRLDFGIRHCIDAFVGGYLDVSCHGSKAVRLH